MSIDIVDCGPARTGVDTSVDAARWRACATAAGLALVLLLAGCGAKGATDPAAGAPEPAKVEQEGNADLVKVAHPDQFPTAIAGRYDSAPSLNVTGVVSADVSRNVPVISIASGRILEVRARLGDTVTKGQLLLRVQSADTASAFSDYRQAVADETLANAQLARSKILYEKGAIAQKDLEVAQDVEEKAKVTVETTTEHLRVLGADKDHPTAVVEIVAPASGVITDQQVTTASGTQGLASPNAFTISDLSHVWIVCDVYENDLAFVHVDEYGEVRLNAYPDRVLRARISNIGPILDPNLRTLKVRLEVENPGFMRLGMFVKATFHGQKKEAHAMVPSTAVLHLHDRDWVYEPLENGQFRRVEVSGGDMLPGKMQEIRTGIQPGQRVVENALVLQNTGDVSGQ
ncbi:Efflux transporter, RND family, MFP subunit [Candidatus Sulfopaludibacter sp. SbA4]|nr:Efflux transporter, RND family, MFP subunit [Candidatus Sulfopaludibacter sp. SbA4]